MDFILDFVTRFFVQLQSPTLGFLLGGMLIAALKSKLVIPNAIYQFIVFMLLMKIGLEGGIAIREAELAEMLVPALVSSATGILIVFVGVLFFSFIPSVKKEDGIATSGLFGAVSASTLAAGMLVLDEEKIQFEAWAPALYPFMDIPALVLAIVLANLYFAKKDRLNNVKPNLKKIVRESLQGAALSALILGLFLGFVTKPEAILNDFYAPLFKGFLSILMLIMGIEAYARLNELRKVAHWFALYALVGPIVHGLIAFGLGYIAHLMVGFSPGGIIILSIIASSNSDISGPPTLRAAISSANPSTYLGASTSIGTPVAIAICIPLFVALGSIVFDF
ncbi:MAG: sodium-dependent bicarbonate transport family permease [Bdellovibrionales bacterium]